MKKKDINIKVRKLSDDDLDKVTGGGDSIGFLDDSECPICNQLSYNVYLTGVGYCSSCGYTVSIR